MRLRSSHALILTLSLTLQQGLTQQWTVESPYFVLREEGINLLKSLSERNIKQVFLTNSLYSTDAFYTVSTLISNLDRLENLDAKVYLYDGTPLDPMSKASWGLHAKRAVFDGRHTLIATYNIDPRSANLNSEVLISCNNNPELARAVLKSMQKRRSHAWRLFDTSRDPLGALTKKASLSQKLKILFGLSHCKSF